MPKRLLVFRGPLHHSQLLRPIEQALRGKGWEIVHYTADTESCFQVPLQEETFNWEWLPDWTNEPEAQALYRVTRLSARIGELRDDGHKIVSIVKKDLTGKKYVKYYSARNQHCYLEGSVQSMPRNRK